LSTTRSAISAAFQQKSLTDLTLLKRCSEKFAFVENLIRVDAPMIYLVVEFEPVPVELNGDGLPLLEPRALFLASVAVEDDDLVLVFAYEAVEVANVAEDEVEVRPHRGRLMMRGLLLLLLLELGEGGF
jgi:hypothetical protein